MVIRLREKGQMTLPSNIRNALKLSGDSVLSVVKVGDAVLLVPRLSTFERVARRFSSRAKKESITLGSLLKELKKVRRGNL